MTSETRRNWSVLPPELLHKIACNLTDISDHHRFHAVCTTWQAISILPLNLPWFLLQRYTDGSKNTILSTFHHTTSYTLPLPILDPYSFCQIFGSAFGYLIITASAISITLLNPFTGSQIPLPSLTISGNELAQIPYHPLIHNRWDSTIRIQRAKLMNSADSDHGFSVILSVSYLGGLIFFHCQPGRDCEWRRLDQPVIISALGVCKDFTYYDDNLVFLRKVVDPTNATQSIYFYRVHMRRESIPLDIMYSSSSSSTSYLVESSCGDLLMVVRLSVDEIVERFEVFRLDKTEQLRWLRVTSIGNDVLFVDRETAVCVAASDVGGCRSNCIYFCGKSGVCLFDITDGIVQKLSTRDNVSQTERFIAWILPRL